MNINQLPSLDSVKTEITRSSLSKRVLNNKEPLTLSLLVSTVQYPAFYLALIHYTLFAIVWAWNKDVAGLSVRSVTDTANAVLFIRMCTTTRRNLWEAT